MTAARERWWAKPAPPPPATDDPTGILPRLGIWTPPPANYNPTAVAVAVAHARLSEVDLHRSLWRTRHADVMAAELVAVCNRRLEQGARRIRRYRTTRHGLTGFTVAAALAWIAAAVGVVYIAGWPR